MRYVVLTLAALLVVVAVAFAQDPGDPPQPAAPEPTTTPNIPPPADTPVPTATPTETPVDPGVPPDFAEVQWHDSKALGKPARKGRLQRRHAAPRARRGLLHLGPDPQPRSPTASGAAGARTA